MTKSKRFLYMLVGLLLFTTSSIYAQTITVGSGSGAPGDQVIIQLDWNNDENSYRSLQFDVNSDLAVLPSVNTVDCPIDPYIDDYIQSSCNQRAEPNEHQVRLGLLRLTGEIPAGNLGQLVYTIAEDAVPGTTDLTLTGVVIEGDPTPTINNGQITVLAGPGEPAYASDPAPGALDPLGPVEQGAADPQQQVAISNVGDDATVLTGQCSETSDPGEVFSITNGNFSVTAGDAAHNVTVTCDSAGAVSTHAGEMSCTHDGGSGGESTPAVYVLSCTIIEPTPTDPIYSSNPATGPINMSAEHEEDPITPVDIAISNVGAPESVLTGTCGFMPGGDPQITVVDGSFSVPEGGAADIQTLSCDSSTAGDYAATLSCAHNGSNASPATYAVSCVVGPALAQFDSDPDAGSTVDMTPGEDPPVGAPPAESVLVLSNIAAEGALDLNIECDISGTGNPPITVTPDLSGGRTIDAQDMAIVTFSCDTSTADSFTASYDCEYTIDGSELPSDSSSSASYTYNCDVREGESSVSTVPASPGTITKDVPTDGSGEFTVRFNEDLDEGVDAELITCSLDNDVDFEFTSPDSFPAVIPAGDSLDVIVVGTDPGEVDSLETVLRCTYDDSSGEGTEDVLYNLIMQIGNGASALIQVTKVFDDDNTAEVRVELTCNSGVPLTQFSDISDGDPVYFVVHHLPEDGVFCEVTEVTSTDGYKADFAASGDSLATSDEFGCYFTNVLSDDSNYCAITNRLLPVLVDVTKQWFMEGRAGNVVKPYARIQVSSQAEIVDGYECAYDQDRWCKHLKFEGPETDTQGVKVYPDWHGSTVYIKEHAVGSEIVSENLCGGSVRILPGSGGACTVTNTVYFEGIPTLNQYGMAIMALLMLGIGLLGFRRFA